MNTQNKNQFVPGLWPNIAAFLACVLATPIFLEIISSDESFVFERHHIVMFLACGVLITASALFTRTFAGGMTVMGIGLFAYMMAIISTARFVQ